MSEFERYEHHDEQVWVRSNLRGRHREHCLCYSCAQFFPGEAKNCVKAQRLYELCVAEHMVTPVWECRAFIEWDWGDRDAKQEEA